MNNLEMASTPKCYEVKGLKSGQVMAALLRSWFLQPHEEDMRKPVTYFNGKGLSITFRPVDSDRTDWFVVDINRPEGNNYTTEFCIDSEDELEQLIQATFYNSRAKNAWNLAAPGYYDVRPMLTKDRYEVQHTLNGKTKRRYIRFVAGDFEVTDYENI